MASSFASASVMCLGFILVRPSLKDISPDDYKSYSHRYSKALAIAAPAVAATRSVGAIFRIKLVHRDVGKMALVCV